MAKLEKDKIALFLACASILGGKTSSKDVDKVKAQSPQTVATVSGGRLLKIQVMDLLIGLKAIN